MTNKKEALVNFPETLNGLWDEAFLRIVPEMPFIIWQDERKTRTISWKEAIALAHCMAGFLLSRGINKGDTFGVLSINNPALIYIDIAGRLIGAIPVMIPEYANTTQVSEIARQTEMKMILVSDPDTYHRALAALGTNFKVKDIVTLFDDEQVLVPGRTAIFDWLIDPGKVYWREHLPEIRQLKASVVSDEICCISYQTREVDEVSSMIDTHASLLKKLYSILPQYSELSEAKSLMPCVPYWDLNNRLKGYYLPLYYNMKVYLPHGTSSIENALRSMQPELVLMSSAQINGLYDRIVGKISLKGWMSRGRYLRALKTGAKYLQALDNQKKPGVLLNWNYRNGKKLMRKGLLKPLNPNLKAIMLSDSGISEPAITFFLHIDLPVYNSNGEKITQANRTSVLSLNPESTPFVLKKMPETEQTAEGV